MTNAPAVLSLPRTEEEYANTKSMVCRPGSAPLGYWTESTWKVKLGGPIFANYDRRKVHTTSTAVDQFKFDTPNTQWIILCPDGLGKEWPVEMEKQVDQLRLSDGDELYKGDSAVAARVTKQVVKTRGQNVTVLKIGMVMLEIMITMMRSC